MKLAHIIITVALAFASALATQAQGVKVTAELDSAVMTQGYRTALRVRVLGPADATPVQWPEKGGQLGGVDVADISSQASDLGNGRRETVYTLTLQPFDPDTVTLPPLRVASGTDTAESRPLVLKVLPVELDSLTEIHPMEGPVAYPARWYDWVPQWASNYWPWILLGLGLIAAAVAGWLYWRRGGTVVVRRKRVVPPYELAMRRLGQLRERRLTENGREKEYYTELTDILRQYLDGRFGINAMEMPSTEIMRTLRHNEATRMSAERMQDVLEVADFVKFAKMRPLPDDNVKAYNSALAFVEDTKPAPEPAEAEKETPKNS
ncbi:MAG: BatD family protein [Muribaculaceae bacterium]|nr:BatD family protein [Muribaculaceae bacterium]